MDQQQPLAILGAGITGITLGWKLKQQNIPFVLFEAKDRPGGNIWTHHEGKYVLENGPNSIQLNDQIHQFLSECGLVGRITKSLPGAVNRYVLKNGKYQKLPSGFFSLIFSSLLSWKDKMSLLREKKVPLGTDPQESLDSFIRRRLSDGIADYLAAPFISGIYAGDANKLLLEQAFPNLRKWEQEYGSVIKGFSRYRKTQTHKGIMAFPKGLGELSQHLASHIKEEIQFNASVSRLEQQAQGWSVEVNGEQKQFKQVVSTLPAYALANILQNESSFTQALSNIRYPALAVVASAYKRKDIQHSLNGFGALHNHLEPSKTLGTIFSSSVFPDRCPPDEVLLITFVGGDKYPAQALQGEEVIKEAVLEDHKRFLGRKNLPVFQKVQLWERSIPQYDKFIAAVRPLQPEIEEKGLILGGNWVSGISVPNCIQHGHKLCEQLSNS